MNKRMQRPLFSAAGVFLAGILLGLKEVPPGIGAGALVMSLAQLWYYLQGAPPGRCRSVPGLPGRQSSGRTGRQFLQQGVTSEQIFGISLILFLLLGFLRALQISSLYNSDEARRFFAAFQATNPGQFDYALYLKGLGIYTREMYDAYRAGSSGTGAGEAPLPWLLAGLRGFFERMLELHVSAEDAGLWKAVLLGQKADLDQELRSLYQSAGIAHLLAVSGLHVGLVGMTLYHALEKTSLSKKAAAMLSALAVFLYMIMTGGSASALRASVMLFFAFAAAGNGRRYHMQTALAASLVLQLCLQPYQVLQAGFQLSFGAVAAICVVNPAVTKALELAREQADRQREMIGSHGSCDRHGSQNIRKRNRLHPVLSTCIMSCSIQLVTLPIILWHYYVFPPYGILLNFIVIPLMTGAVWSGMGVLAGGAGVYGAARLIQVLGSAGKPFRIADMLSGIFSIILRIFSLVPQIAAAPGHYIFRFYEILCRWTQALPFGSVCVGRPALWQICIYYALLAGCVLWLKAGALQKTPCMMVRKTIKKMEYRALRNMAYKTQHKTGFQLVCLCAFMILASLTLRPLPERGLTVTAVDVGQGDGFVIRCGGHTLLVDGGSTSNEKLGENVLEPLLLSQGITRIDACFISHGDRDHTSGVEYLLDHPETFQIGALILPAPAEGNEKYDGLLTAVGAADKPKIRYLKKGQRFIDWGDLRLTCLYAGNADASEDTNRHSTALLLEYGAFSMLFTGDMAAEDEPALCRSYEEYATAGTRNLTVLKVAHHGSAGSTTDELLETLRPAYALISVGRRNSYGHPSPETLERLSAHGVIIYRTAGSGAITLRVQNRPALPWESARGTTLQISELVDSSS